MTLLYRWLIGAAIVSLLSGGIFLYAYNKGDNACEIRHARANEDAKKKARKDDAKIDKKTPNLNNKRRSIEWLQKYTTDRY